MCSQVSMQNKIQPRDEDNENDPDFSGDKNAKMEKESSTENFKLLTRLVRDEMHMLDEQIAEHAIAAHQRFEAETTRERLKQRIVKLKSDLQFQKESQRVEIQVYEDKLRFMTKKYQRKLLQENERTSKERDAKLRVRDLIIHQLEKEIALINSKRKTCRDANNQRLIQINRINKMRINDRYKIQKQKTIQLARFLSSNLEQEVKRQKRLCNEHYMIAAYRHKKTETDLQNSHERMMKSSNQDQRDMIGPKITMIQTLHDEWRTLSTIVRKSAERKNFLIAEHNALNDSIRALESEKRELQNQLVDSNSTRKELRSSKARGLVSEDTIRILRWKHSQTKLAIERAEIRRDKLLRNIRALMEQVRIKRERTSEKLMHQLSNVNKGIQVTR
eukprot:jgi/Bigna1/146649/aug1.118_g21357